MSASDEDDQVPAMMPAEGGRLAAELGVTWLPALTTSTVERARLEVRGVAMPQIRKNLDR